MKKSLYLICSLAALTATIMLGVKLSREEEDLVLSSRTECEKFCSEQGSCKIRCEEDGPIEEHSCDGPAQWMENTMCSCGIPEKPCLGKGSRYVLIEPCPVVLKSIDYGPFGGTSAH